MLRDVNRERALAVSEHIRSSFAEVASVIDSCPVHSTVSVGVVVEHAATADITALLAQADQALYYAKSRGRNRVELASLDVVLDRAKLRTSVTPAHAQSAA